MRPAYYEENWLQLKQQASTDSLESLAQRIASSFVDRYFYSDEYNSGYIHLLCDMATWFDDDSLNQIAARVLFGTVIERLCDDFEELQTETYNRLICQVVSFLRGLPGGKPLHDELNEFQLETENQLYQRIEAIRLSPDEKLPSDLKPRKIILLSRVTIGADVAITSVIIQRLRALFPAAKIAVVGNAKLGQVFSSESGTSIHELHYSRRGGLLERFLVWVDLLHEIRSELDGFEQNEYLLLDPDSRLTQLGVLPLVHDRNYRFFNSRGKSGYPPKASITELTNLWLDNILGKGEFCYPKVWPPGESVAPAKRLRDSVCINNDITLIAMNFGVGGNHRKMVGADFEIELVLSLLKYPDIRIILDLGFGAEEQQRSDKILKAAENRGLSTAKLRYNQLSDEIKNCRLIGVECSISEIASLISQSNEFIGYDSACQHIAAAQGIKTYTIFAGTNNVRFIRRWHACGPATSEIIYVDTISKEQHLENHEIIERLLDLRSN